MIPSVQRVFRFRQDHFGGSDRVIFRVWRLAATVLFSGVLFLATGPQAIGADVTVFAAASLKNAMDDIHKSFETETGISLSVSFAGSALLARQIERGAPADIFFPASPDWMDYLEAEERIVSDSRRDLLQNRLVLIAPRQTAKEISGFQDPMLLEQLGEGKLAMGLVAAVPAGIYGKSALQSVGLWPDLEERIAQSDNVRAALALVAIGEAPLGVVYASDAKAEPRVKVLAEFPETSHPPIRYPIALTRPADNQAAVAFHSYLQGPEARAAFQAAGFATVGE